jgi:hypothetical protein
MYTVAVGRPAWLVLNADRVDLVRALDLDPRHLDEARPEYRQPPWSGPQWVFAPLPEDVETRNDLTLESAFGGSDVYQRPEFYRPLAEGRALIEARAHPLDELEHFNGADEVRAALAAWPEADAWLPMMSNVREMVVLLRKAEGRIVAIVALRPN